MQYVNLAVRACAQRRRSQLSARDPRDTCPVKRDSSGQIRKNRDRSGNSAPFSVPYGPHLIPVSCQKEEPATLKHPEVGTAVTSQEDGAVRLDKETDCSSGLAPRRPCDRADGTPEQPSEVCGEQRLPTITTNDLLDCLVHPDIITRVTELLLERHTGSHGTNAPSQL